MCRWIYQEHDCSHWELLELEECPLYEAGLQCRAAEKERIAAVGPSGYTCKQCFEVHLPSTEQIYFASPGETNVCNVSAFHANGTAVARLDPPTSDKNHAVTTSWFDDNEDEDDGPQDGHHPQPLSSHPPFARPCNMQ